MIFKFVGNPSHREIVQVRQEIYDWWADGGKTPLCVSGDIELIDWPMQVPDAICRYCGVANLKSSAWCEKCGAPLLTANLQK